MERRPVQSRWWRVFAMFVLAVLLLASTKATFADTAWEAARSVYWLMAPLGLLGYAFGFRVLPVFFWRVYAVIFVLEITIRAVPFAMLVVARALGQTDNSQHNSLLIVSLLVCIALIGFALLRYADIITGGRIEIVEPHQAPPEAPSRSTSRAVKPVQLLGSRGAIAGLTKAIFGSSLIGSLGLSAAVTAVEFGPVRFGSIYLVPLIMLLAIPASAMLVTVFALLAGLPFTWAVSRLNIEGPWTYGVGGFVLGLFLLLGGAPSQRDLII